MDENNKKRVKGLICLTGFLSMGLASQIGLYVLISVLQGNSITSVVLFVAGIVATTIWYLISVLGGVPLPGPKKRVANGGNLPPSPASVVIPPSPLGGVLPPGPRGQLIFFSILSITFISQIGLFIMIRSLQGISISSVTLLIAGLVGSSISYLAVISGGVPLPGPKGGVGLPDPKNG